MPSPSAARVRLSSSDTPPQWPVEEVSRIYHQPLFELIEQAHAIHRQCHIAADGEGGEVQLCHLLSIKTGGCPEDCAYCPQSARHHTGIEAGKLLETDTVLAEAERARDAGATRFCMGAAWRNPKPGAEFDRVLDMVRGVAGLGLEVCCTLGMLSSEQAHALSAAGLTAYNHNLDTSPEFYGHIISTRTYQDRLDTLERVRSAGISVCCGGILGMGEDERDRIRLLATLANLTPQPESVPINALVAVEGTPLAAQARLDAFEFVRAIASARILMPRSKVRLSAGRLSLSDEAQALCFYAGANSIFVGDKLLTTPNPEVGHDHQLLHALGLKPERREQGTGNRGNGEVRRPIPLEEALREELAAREAQHLRRRLRRTQGLDYCSNDYLGLAQHPGVRSALASALANGIALGSGGARLVRGNHPAFSALEEQFAAWQGAEAGLFFSSGYAANVGTVTALVKQQDTIFSDAHNHASLIDGIRLTGARKVLTPHRDPEAFASALRRHPAMHGERRWLVVESLYSMDGDLAQLEDYAALCAEAGVAMIVDEAHATGIFGPGGAGFVAAGSPLLRSAVAAHLHPCGKALGASGALVAGSHAVIATLVNHSRSFVFSTAPAPLLAVQVAEAIAVVQREPERRAEVRRLAAQLRQRLQDLGIPALGDLESPIVPVVAGDAARALAIEAELAAAGLDVRAIRPPSVPAGTARLRITVHAGQRASEMERLAATLAGAMRAGQEAAAVV